MVVKRFFRDDIEYRIANLRFAITEIKDNGTVYPGWEAGYRQGRLFSMESELRFLERLVKEVGDVGI